jgi:hypothetical protein
MEWKMNERAMSDDEAAAALVRLGEDATAEQVRRGQSRNDVPVGERGVAVDTVLLAAVGRQNTSAKSWDDAFDEYWEKWRVSSHEWRYLLMKEVGYHLAEETYVGETFDEPPPLPLDIEQKMIDLVQSGWEPIKTDLTSVVHEYAFDCTLRAAIRVKGTSREQAETCLRESMDAADCNGGAWPNGDPILFEASVADGELALYELDGQPVEEAAVSDTSWKPRETGASRHRYSFGTISAPEDQRLRLNAAGLDVGDYDAQLGNFYVCADSVKVDREALSRLQVEMINLHPRDEVRLAADDYPATKAEIEAEIAWSEFMLHAPVGSAFRRQSKTLDDIGTSLFALRQALILREGDPRPVAPLDVGRPLYDEGGREHRVIFASNAQVVTDWSGTFGVWDRRTGACLIAGCEEARLANEKPNADWLARKRVAAGNLFSAMHANAAIERAREPSAQSPSPDM